MGNTEGAVELSVNAILATIDDFLKESGTRTHRALAGLEARATNVELFSLLEDITRAEPVAFVRELTTSSRIDATKKGRVERLYAALLELATQARLAPHDDAITALLSSKTIASAGRTWTLAESLSDAWTLSTPEARALVSNDRSAALWDEQPPFARRLDALSEAAAAFAQPSSRALVEAMQRRTFEQWEPKAEALLNHSDDPSRDLSAFALKRLDQQLKPTNAKSTDLARALAAPWFFEVLRREDLSHAVTRTLTELGFHPNAFGRILIDTDSQGRLPGAHLVRVEVPDQLRLIFTAAPGFEGYAGWLGAWGEAQLLSATPRTLPFIDRVIGDSTLTLAVRRLFESLLLDEAWLKRHVRATSAQAREVARVFAWRQVMAMRAEAALLPVQREGLERGAVRGLADAYANAMERAHVVQPERGRFLLDTAPLTPSMRSLDAWALEAHLASLIRERFNEDWWRNPAAGRFLNDLAMRGSTEDATTVATSLGGPPLELTNASRRRVVVMGA